jgi:hypothetical protein
MTNYVEARNKLEKFTRKIEKLICFPEEQRNDIQIQNSINQFYYMQKIEELKLLEESVHEAIKRLKFFQEKFESEYAQVYCRWRKDVRFLNKLTTSSQKGDPSLA